MRVRAGVVVILGRCGRPEADSISAPGLQTKRSADAIQAVACDLFPRHLIITTGVGMATSDD